MLLNSRVSHIHAVDVFVVLKPVRGGWVVGWCWVNFQCLGVLLLWILVWQVPTALAVGAGGGCLEISLFFLPLSGLVDCFVLNGPLRQYFRLYRVISRSLRKRREKIEEGKNIQTTPIRTYCKRNRPLPYYHPNCRTPRHWKYTQDHRMTRPLPSLW